LQSKKKTILAVAALVVIAAVLLLVWRAVTPKGEAGEKTITVQVLHKDGEERVFTLETGEAYLGAVLTAEGVVEDNQGPYGLYMLTVDGETVDEGAQEWWKLTKGGEMVNSSADSTPIADGDHFELTFTVGYDGLG
jgi:hypothetical protein